MLYNLQDTRSIITFEKKIPKCIFVLEKELGELWKSWTLKDNSEIHYNWGLQFPIIETKMADYNGACWN